MVLLNEIHIACKRIKLQPSLLHAILTMKSEINTVKMKSTRLAFNRIHYSYTICICTKSMKLKVIAERLFHVHCEWSITIIIIKCGDLYNATEAIFCCTPLLRRVLWISSDNDGWRFFWGGVKIFDFGMFWVCKTIWRMAVMPPCLARVVLW